jgi:hypothetical protein
MSKEDFESAERFWSGKPSLDALDAQVSKMKEREAMREIDRISKTVRIVGRMVSK